MYSDRKTQMENTAGRRGERHYIANSGANRPAIEVGGDQNEVTIELSSDGPKILSVIKDGVETINSPQDNHLYDDDVIRLDYGDCRVR